MLRTRHFMRAFFVELFGEIHDEIFSKFSCKLFDKLILSKGPTLRGLKFSIAKLIYKKILSSNEFRSEMTNKLAEMLDDMLNLIHKSNKFWLALPTQIIFAYIWELFQQIKKNSTLDAKTLFELKFLSKKGK